ncbi:MAG: protein kinase domain-containing protein, partial [Verrucomicrobiia bacterium]
MLRLVGRGSYGDVWLARGATGLYFAVKVVWRDRFNDIGPYEREFRGLSDFMRLTGGEARQLALLHVGRNDEDGFFFYVMELADDVVTGRHIDPSCYAPLTLKDLRANESFLPVAETLRHGIDLAQGLTELHTAGLIHRDIKPSNIILVGGRPKLADIGLVSEESEAMSFVGTEGFVPPEGPGTAAADIFSLGKVLYEVTTGCDRNDFPRLPADFGEREDRPELLELNEVIIKA